MGLDLTGLGSVANLAQGLVNRFLPPAMNEKEKAAAQIEIERMLEQRETALIVDNVRRYLAGRRLRNLVDHGAGY